MKLPSKFVNIMQENAKTYEPKQKAWFQRNLPKLLKLIHYDIGNANTISGYNLLENCIHIYQNNYGTLFNDCRIVETAWHEYGHYIFESLHFQNWRKVFEAEVKQVFNIVNLNDLESSEVWEWQFQKIEKAYDLKNMPPMFTDAIGILTGYEWQQYHSHKAGYSLKYLDTEMFAETFAAYLTNDWDTLNDFHSLCPKTACIIIKQIKRIVTASPSK